MFKNIVIAKVDKSYEQPLGLFIDNEFIKSRDEATIESLNPSTGEKIASFYAASEADVDAAVAAARRAFPSWSHTSPEERGILLRKLGDLIEQEKELLAAIETLDSGKPYKSNALGDLDQIISLTRYFAGAADKFSKGEYIPVNKDKYALTLKEPYGVVGQVVPWNYPLAMASWKIQGCLAAGNTIVIKPAENTSLSLLYAAQLFKKAGFPPGVVNIIPGHGGIAGSRLASHPDVDKIAFTGSTAVGQKIMSLAALSNLKAVTLECGGKSPAVIFDDASIEEAVKWTSMGIFYNSGQNCTANSRIYVQESIYEEFLSRFIKHVTTNWTFGEAADPFDNECTVGPVISKTQYDRIQSYIEHAQKNENLKTTQIGAAAPGCNGFFIPPTIVTDVPQDSKLMKEEIFGPVAVISRFRDYGEVIKLANDTNYGLAAAVFTESIRQANRFAHDIKAGTVWVNSSNDEEISVPFGGYKMSGIGRELGQSGMDAYTQTKGIHVNMAKL
ncbi:LAMI_0E02586g1_1 [Lachancea mirantina]|uniref:LAMI_0E02586g1_1 n=1 Tax=Lachancea mirantina TaxID=1230905 RepID=A0A1G4JJ94_9SACH|nr:LAMI_0E02586g1_1 [Lachancea mirantina]